MGLIKWLLDCSIESPLQAVIIWLGIGYVNTFIIRFLCRAPCRFDGDEFESSNFWKTFLSGPVGLLAIPVFIIEAIYHYFQITLPNLREQKRIAKTKLPHDDEQETLPPPLHLI